MPDYARVAEYNHTLDEKLDRTADWLAEFRLPFDLPGSHKLVPINERYLPHDQALAIVDKWKDVEKISAKQYGTKIAKPSMQQINDLVSQNYPGHKRIYGWGKMCDVFDSVEGIASLVLESAGLVAGIIPGVIVWVVDNALEYGIKAKFAERLLKDEHGKKYVFRLGAWEFGLGTLGPVGDIVDICSRPYLKAGTRTVNDYAKHLIARELQPMKYTPADTGASSKGKSSNKNTVDAEFTDLPSDTTPKLIAGPRQ
jgi:hypothetical protein